MWPTPTAITTTTAAVTLAATAVVLAAHAASGKFRRCQCGRRRSTLSYDQFVCPKHRGFECWIFVSRCVD